MEINPLKCLKTYNFRIKLEFPYDLKNLTIEAISEETG
jgi:hypothetical protein